MPFTISHAAAALPLHFFAKHRLPLAALMVGCMSPDFAFFLPFYVGRLETHSLAGVFWFCLPASLCVWLFFHRVLERPTLAFLPDAWRVRIQPSDRLTSRTLLMAALAIVLGAASHLVWDAFTHDSTPVVEALPAFRSEVFDAGGRAIRVYFLLQLLSSVFGLYVLAAWALGIRKRTPLPPSQVVPEPQPRVANFERWLAVLMIAGFSCAVGFINLARYGDLQRNASLFVLLVGGMVGAALGWTVVAIAIRFRIAQGQAQPNAE